MTYLWTSLSFGILGAVFWWRRFDRYFAGMCVIIAVVGCWFPAVLIVPFFLVFWRILIGRNIQTDSKLLIGQERFHDKPHDTDSSQTTSHWIVAICPNSDSEVECQVIDAVGEVVSGKGIKKSRKMLRKDMEEKYEVTCVGWVTRKDREQHKKSVIDNEPMASGYSCQEYALDIAFQLSCSRTYTFMKSIGLLRVRTVVYYSLLMLSVMLYVVSEYLHLPVIILVPISPSLFNPVIVTNCFVASEAFRLGYTNLRQEDGWFQGLKDRVNVFWGYINSRDKVKLALVFVYTILVHVLMENVLLTISVMMVCIFIARS